MPLPGPVPLPSSWIPLYVGEMARQGMRDRGKGYLVRDSWVSGEPYPVTCSLMSLQNLFWRGGGPVFPTFFQVPSVYVIPGLNTPLTADLSASP